MKTIWKYPIAITDVQEIEMPQRAGILHAGLDPTGQPCIWAQVDSGNPKCIAKVFVVGTGNPIPQEAHGYVGSFVQGPFVWHVYTSF